MNKEKEEVEINLLELGKKLWDNKRFIIKCSIIGAVVGLVIAFSIPKEYTTTVILTTESGKSAGGSMGALASMAGINLGGTDNEEILSPELYPNILNSTPFAQSLLQVSVEDEKQGINTSLYNYLLKNQKQPWWSDILKAPALLLSTIFSNDDNCVESQKKDTRYISREEMALIEKLLNSYSITIEKKTGMITINVISQSPEIGAFLADTLTDFLQTYVIEHRTKKARTTLINNEKLFEQSKINYYHAQQSLASFIDANMNVISAKYKINQEKLQNEASIAYTVYNQMAQQVQMSKIKVQDDTPVFVIIQPAVKSLYPTSPKKIIYLLTFVMLSISISSIWILRTKILNLLQTK